MALSYADTSALMGNQPFRERVKIACLKFADYISNEAPNVTAHWTRIRWAQMCFGSADNAMQQIMPLIVMDGQVQLDGEAITDQALQPVVENAINKLM
jgi:hypothetical protein